MRELTNKSHSHGKFQQWLAAIIVNLSAMAYGISLGWPSPITAQLKSNHPPIGTSSLTDNEISWVASLHAMGCCLSIPLSGILAERFGRKAFGYVTGLLLIISWLLIVFGTSHVHYLYAARLVAGMSSSMSAFIVPLYVSEIANEDVRGALCSLLIFSVKIGILFAYVAGAYLSYISFNILALIFPVIFIVAFAFMPETPVYLVRRNRLDQARESLMFLRANNRAVVEQQLTDLQSQANTANEYPSKVNLAYLFKDRATRKGLTISLGIIAAQQFCGIMAMINYATPIFKQTGSSVSSDIAAIIIAAIQVFSSYLATILMERAGRRLLGLCSSLGMAISHFTVGSYFYLHDNNHNVESFSWLPVVALSTFMISYCLGIGPLPWIVTYEVFRHEVASFASTLCFVVLWIMSFFIVKMFGFALNLFGGGCFFMLSAFCLAGFVFVYYKLPETKGRKREDIVDELAGIIKDTEFSRNKPDGFEGEEAEKIYSDAEKTL